MTVRAEDHRRLRSNQVRVELAGGTDLVAMLRVAVLQSLF